MRDWKGMQEVAHSGVSHVGVVQYFSYRITKEGGRRSTAKRLNGLVNSLEKTPNDLKWMHYSITH